VIFPHLRQYEAPFTDTAQVVIPGDVVTAQLGPVTRYTLLVQVQHSILSSALPRHLDPATWRYVLDEATGEVTVDLDAPMSGTVVLTTLTSAPLVGPEEPS
jgi:hypothetical protein